MNQIFLIPGMGADTRIYNNIELPEDWNITTVDWIEPHKTDTLETYVQKLIYQYDIKPNCIIIGNSLGGMLAIEIAKKIKLKKVILISSIKTINEAPWYYGLFKAIPIYKFIPGNLFTSLGFLIKPFFGKMKEDDLWLFKDMLQKTSHVFLKWAMGAALKWDNTVVTTNLYQIHGDKDHVFPINSIKDVTVIKGGSHIMIFDKAKQINKWLKPILKKMKLPESFYIDTDVVHKAKSLLGKYLFTSIDGKITGGYIVETEAYNGVIDRASHAYGNRLTPRTKTMFMQGGIAYVYLCYGIHEMFNVVTSVEGQPHAILIRAIQPTEGIETMLFRRNMLALKPNITQGPGSVAKALGISRAINAISLQSDTLWIEDRGLVFEDEDIAAVPRVGVDSAGTDALLPYRFYVKGNPYVSKPNK